MIKVRTITDIESFSQIAEQWSSLLDRCRHATVFSTFSWLSEWWRVYGGNRELVILAAWDDQTNLVGLAPLVSRPVRAADWALWRTFEPLGDGVSDYVGFIAAEGMERLVCLAFLREIGKYGRRWGLTLMEVPTRSPTAKEAVDCANSLGYRVRVREASQCSYITLPSSWEEYMRGLRSRLRTRASTYIRRLLEHDGCRLTIATTEPERAAAMKALAHLHELRWRAKASGGNFANPQYVQFHEAVSKALLTANELRLLTLHHQSEPIGALYGFLYRDTFCAYQSGFDPKWSKRSVGTVMLALAIKAAIEEGACEFDLMRGASEYKARWASGVRTNIRVDIWPGTLAQCASDVGCLSRRAADALRARLFSGAQRCSASGTLRRCDGP